MTYKTRKFDGKKYFLDTDRPIKKKNAQARAKSLRKNEYGARVIKVGHGKYQVWMQSKM